MPPAIVSHSGSAARKATVGRGVMEMPLSPAPQHAPAKGGHQHPSWWEAAREGG